MPTHAGRRAPALVLFDIDGTLLRRSGPHHRAALVEAVRRVTGMETTTDSIPVQGMLDRDILTEMLRAVGVDDDKIQSWMPELVRRAQWLYARTCPPDLSERVCPGVPALLDRIRVRRLLAGLVSGNLTRIGWKKLERAGLKRFFRYGVFADRGKTRGELARIAIEEALAQEWVEHSAQMTLIGDHPNDIQAARECGIRAVAVATGLSSAEELARHSPDLVLDDLRALPIEFLFS